MRIKTGKGRNEIVRVGNVFGGNVDKIGKLGNENGGTVGKIVTIGNKILGMGNEIGKHGNEFCVEREPLICTNLH